MNYSPERREALRRLGLGVAALPLAGAVLEQALAAPLVPWNTISGLTPLVTSQQQLYYVSKNISFFDPAIAGSSYRLQVGGMVDRPLTLTLENLQALPAVSEYVTLSCISNPVGGNLIGNVLWKGVRLTELLKRAGIQPGATWMDTRAQDGYFESIPLAAVLRSDVILAYAINGQPLIREHGYPVRLLIPGRYGMKQPKWITEITLSKGPQPGIGYWEERGWSKNAITRTLSRIDVPQAGARLKAGSPTWIAGIAWAGGRHIDAVQVSTDNGRTWQGAAVRPPLSPTSWVQWALAWTPQAGAHTLVVRAVAEGKLQSEAPEQPLPDGASGWMAVPVQVS